MAYQKTENLLDLAIWMQSSREGVSLQDIMDRFNVSRRTAERMRDLILCRFPQSEEIIGENNKKYWCIPQGTLRDFIQFSAEELSCLELAQKTLNKSNLPEAAVRLSKITEKIKSNIKPDVYRRIEPDAEELARAEGIALRPGPKLKINQETVDTLRRAILQCNQVKIKYKNKSSGKISWYTLNPYGFLYGDRNHYLVASHTDGYFGEEVHQLILSNILSVQILPQFFVFPEGFSLEEYASRSFGAYHEEPFDVEWLFAAEVAEEAANFVFHPSQQIVKNEDGSLTVKFRAGGRVEMDWHLYTWGNSVKVIKPQK